MSDASSVQSVGVEQSEGYRKLRAAILADYCRGLSESVRMEKLTFAVERATHYEEHTGIPAGNILTAWESRRNYWYMNYYQNANQPRLDGFRVRVFETVNDMMGSAGKEFRCPYCETVSTNPYRCNSGTLITNLKGHEGPCDWSVGGLFADLGKGVYVFVRDRMQGEHIFLPITWEIGQKFAM